MNATVSLLDGPGRRRASKGLKWNRWANVGWGGCKHVWIAPLGVLTPNTPFHSCGLCDYHKRRKTERERDDLYFSSLLWTKQMSRKLALPIRLDKHTCEWIQPLIATWYCGKLCGILSQIDGYHNLSDILEELSMTTKIWLLLKAQCMKFSAI